MNNWVISNNNNTTTATGVAGLRIDATGNVRIGTLAPVAVEGKLQLDGNFTIKQNDSSQFTARNGRVYIGNTSPTLFAEAEALDPSFKMIVNGKIRTKDEFYVKNAGLTWPDYVFYKDYPLLPLAELQKQIDNLGYLPNMPSAAGIESEGIPITKIVSKQLEKIEELTLYLIEMKKDIEALKKG